MASFFADKESIPTGLQLKKALGTSHPLWQELETYTLQACPLARGEWHYPGIKYGWSYQIRDRKRTLVYLIPQDKFFRFFMVFGARALEGILNSPVREKIKTELRQARPYAEGRGLRLEIHSGDQALLGDIKALIPFKLAPQTLPKA